MANKVLIMTDTSCDIKKEVRDEKDIIALPFTININDKEYFDGVDITVDEMFEYIDKTGKLPKTAARSVQDVKDIVAQHRQNGEDVVWISISGQCSVLPENVKAAFKELGDDNLYFVDSKALSGGVALMVFKACQMRDEGKSGSEIAEELRRYADKVQVSFMVENLTFVHKGGRVSGLSAFVGGILKIRPTLRVIDGRITVGKKYMGKGFEAVIEKYVDETLTLYPNYDDECCVITHCYADPKILDMAINRLKEKASFKRIEIYTAGPTISTHCGKGTLGVLYLCKI